MPVPAGLCPRIRGTGHRRPMSGDTRHRIDAAAVVVAVGCETPGPNVVRTADVGYEARHGRMKIRTAEERSLPAGIHEQYPASSTPDTSAIVERKGRRPSARTVCRNHESR